MKVEKNFGNAKVLKFIYSEKVTKFWKISTLLLSYVVPVKSKVEILQNFVPFLEYMNFTAQSRFSTTFGLKKLSLNRGTVAKKRV